jgi:DNA-binding transcriptional regulator YdaS (Cro superfamily)
MPPSLHQLALHRAAELLGGPDALAAVLDVNPHVVTRWIDGTLRIPQRVFLKVVDIVLDQEIKALHAEPAAPDSRESPGGRT